MNFLWNSRFSSKDQTAKRGAERVLLAVFCIFIALLIAVGAGGSSKLVHDRGKRIERVENVKDVWNYITRIDEMIERKRAGIEAWL